MAPKSNLIHPTITLPVGSQARVEALEPVLLETVATCSRPVMGRNRGCAVWDECHLPWRGEGPRNVAYRQSKDGLIREVSGHCYTYVKTRDTAMQNGGFAELVSTETFTPLGTVPLHMKRDPDCPACAKGNCREVLDPEPEKVLPMLPPEKHPLLLRYARAKQDRDRIAAQESADARSDAYGMPRMVNEPVTEAAASSAGASAGGHGRSRPNAKATP